MNIKIKIRNKIGITKEITIGPAATISIHHRNSKTAALFLMRKILEHGCSLICYGSLPDYYNDIADIAPLNSFSVSQKSLKDIEWPWIEDISETAKEKVKKCLIEYNLGRTFNYRIRLKDSYLLKDPNFYQSFYQIRGSGIKKEKAILEAFLTSILSQSLAVEPMKEIFLFIDSPFKPLTETALETLNESADFGVNIICMYKGNGDKYDSADYVIEEVKNKLYIYKNTKGNKRRYEIIE